MNLITVKDRNTMNRLLAIVVAMIVFVGYCKTSSDSRAKGDVLITRDSTTLFRDSSYSKIEFVRNGDILDKHITTQKYLWNVVYDKYGPISEREVVVSQKIEWLVNQGKEGNDPTLQAKCYLIENGNRSKLLWEINQEADEGCIWQDFYKTVWYGCCSARPNTTLYNIISGTKILEYTRDELLTIEIPNSPLGVRYIGYKCMETALHEDYELNGNYFGTLTYSSEDSCLEKYVIRMRSKSDYDKYSPFGEAHISFMPDTTKNRIGPDSRLVLWAANRAQSPAAISGITIKFESCFDTPCSYRIDLRNDALDFSSISDSNLEITRIK